MKRLRDIVRLERRQGDSVSVGDTVVTLLSQALIVRFGRAGLVFNRPTGVRVEREGRTESVKVVDVTRRVQMALLGLGLGMFMCGVRGRSRERRRDHEKRK